MADGRSAILGYAASLGRSVVSLALSFSSAISITGLALQLRFSEVRGLSHGLMRSPPE